MVYGMALRGMTWYVIRYGMVCGMYCMNGIWYGIVYGINEVLLGHAIRSCSHVEYLFIKFALK